MVDLADARDDRRLRDTRGRVRAVAETTRRTLERLFQTEILFTRAGARLGRDLLLAHQHLLRAGDLLSRLEAVAIEGGGDGDTEALYAQVHALLARTGELSARSEGLLGR